MRLVRDVAPVERLRYLIRLGFDQDDAGRLPVANDRTEQAGMYVEAESGESRFLEEGDYVPDGVWISQRDIDDLKPNGGVEVAVAGHGFGEGWGKQREQFGGDRSYPEDDAGGARRVPHDDDTENIDLSAANPVG